MSNTTQALSRIEAILDDSGFVEIGAGVTARSTDFNIQEKEGSIRWCYYRIRSY